MGGSESKPTPSPTQSDIQIKKEKEQLEAEQRIIAAEVDRERNNVQYRILSSEEIEKTKTRGAELTKKFGI